MSLIGLYARFDLCLNTGILRKQGRVAVGRAARDDLNLPGVLKRTKRADNVAPVDTLEVRKRFAVPVLPVAGKKREVVIPFLPELLAVCRRRLDFAPQVA